MGDWGRGCCLGLGGLAEGIIGLTGGAPTPSVPGAGRTARDFNALLSTYLNAQPSIFNAQQQFGPQYTGLDISGISSNLPTIEQLLSGANFAGAAGNTSTVSGLGPSAGAGWNATYNALNPNTGPLLNNLTSSANTQLAAGDQLDPATLASITNNVRSDWSGRGLGTSQPTAFNEAVAEATGGQNLLNQRTQNAQAAAGLNESVNSSLIAPTVSTVLQQSQAPALTTGLVTGAGPSIVSPSQSQDFLNTGYNAQAAANIAGANNQAALLAGFGNFD